MHISLISLKFKLPFFMRYEKRENSIYINKKRVFKVIIMFKTLYFDKELLSSFGTILCNVHNYRNTQKHLYEEIQCNVIYIKTPKRIFITKKEYLLLFKNIKMFSIKMR